ncbi:MAG: hypothetical protein Greene041662_860 [Candidatus Peregrinibacteria bacterium Greene0416_62]|nr:MAG: hypothetical protein Greene041662_860 [Candidatus Peregrinibacteria bacterium Greene0416_62]TSD00742.1 MAG: hypothetical protein Greene101449_5 [Candidatus Peregrinibacteria bacterium Greene1014_49]
MTQQKSSRSLANSALQRGLCERSIVKVCRFTLHGASYSSDCCAAFSVPENIRELARVQSQKHWHIVPGHEKRYCDHRGDGRFHAGKHFHGKNRSWLCLSNGRSISFPERRTTISHQSVVSPGASMDVEELSIFPIHLFPRGTNRWMIPNAFHNILSAHVFAYV